jgi:hypothetical protein
MAQIIIPFTLYGGEVVGEFKENKETGYHAYFVTDEKKGLKNARPAGVTTINGIKDKSRPLLSWSSDLVRDFLEEKLSRDEPITMLDVATACKLYEVRKTEAGNIGDQIHKWAEAYIGYRLELAGCVKPEIPNEKAVQLGVIAFLDWEAQHKVKFVSSERIVYSREHGYIGKMDIEAIIDGKRSLTDLKTGNGLYNDVRMQTAAYAFADIEESGKPYDTRWAIRLSKETKDEYDARMAKKGKKDWADYQVFEAMEFADGIDEDFAGFLAAKKLYEWNKATDFYQNKIKK